MNKRDVLWESGQDAMQMGILLSGRLKAVLRANNDAALHTTRTLQVILPGTIFGELGLLSRGTHSRTIIASADSRLAMLSRDSLDEIEETDKVRRCCYAAPLAIRTVLYCFANTAYTALFASKCSNSVSIYLPHQQPLLCVLQHLALRTAAGRSHELMLFSAGSLGP